MHWLVRLSHFTGQGYRYYHRLNCSPDFHSLFQERILVSSHHPQASALIVNIHSHLASITLTGLNRQNSCKKYRHLAKIHEVELSLVLFQELDVGCNLSILALSFLSGRAEVDRDVVEMQDMMRGIQVLLQSKKIT